MRTSTLTFPHACAHPPAAVVDRGVYTIPLPSRRRGARDRVGDNGITRAGRAGRPPPARERLSPIRLARETSPVSKAFDPGLRSASIRGRMRSCTWPCRALTAGADARARRGKPSGTRCDRNRRRARGVPSRDGFGRGDRHHLRLQIRHAARKRSGLLSVQHFGGITSSCGASRCRAARYSSSTSPVRRITCTTAPSSASSGCRAMR